VIAAYLYNRTGKKNGQHPGEFGPEEVLALRRKRGKAYVIADASGLYDVSFLVPGLIEVGCNMHGRCYFLDDGTLPIDNGVVERLHKRPAMGRRAYLFAGSDLGAERAAIAYSVLGTCRLRSIIPLVVDLIFA